LSRESNQSQIEITLYIVLKFQFDHACFQNGYASANFGGKLG